MAAFTANQSIMYDAFYDDFICIDEEVDTFIIDDEYEELEFRTINDIELNPTPTLYEIVLQDKPVRRPKPIIVGTFDEVPVPITWAKFKNYSTSYQIMRINTRSASKPKSEMCRSLVQHNQCNKQHCNAAHNFKTNIQVCNRPDCGVIRIGADLYVAEPMTACYKKHENECIESYILRLQYKTKMNSMTIDITKDALKQHQRMLLSNAKECTIKELTTNIIDADTVEE